MTVFDDSIRAGTILLRVSFITSLNSILIFQAVSFNILTMLFIHIFIRRFRRRVAVYSYLFRELSHAAIDVTAILQ